MKKYKIFILVGALILLLSTMHDIIFPFHNWSLWSTMPLLRISYKEFLFLIGSVLIFIGVLSILKIHSIPYKRTLFALLVILFMILTFTIINIIKFKGHHDDLVFYTMILFLYYTTLSITFILLFYRNKDMYMYFAVGGFMMLALFSSLNIINQVTFAFQKFTTVGFNLANIGRNYDGIGYLFIIIGSLSNNKVVSKNLYESTL